MYMVRLENVSSSTENTNPQSGGDGGGIGIAAGESRLFPADRCTWIQENLTNGYGIKVVVFYAWGGQYLFNTADLESSLGYIGKSGRFVPISVPIASNYSA